MVKDKINYRARGPNTMLTRQPVQGRANDGGLRVGEMERDGLAAHGLAYFLNESFLVRGDEYYMAVCNKTGSISIYNDAKNLFLSPYADGPIQFHTNPDGGMNIKNLSRFGRSFSLLRVPYSFKLLIQELQVMNIQMRIITEDNVDQLMSMSYSNNIAKLLHKDDQEEGNKEQMEETIKTYVRQLTTTMRRELQNQTKPEVYSNVNETPELPSQDLNVENNLTEESPAFVPPNIEPNSDQTSIGYNPYTPVETSSPIPIPIPTEPINSETEAKSVSPSTNIEQPASILEIPKEPEEDSELKEEEKEEQPSGETEVKKIISISTEPSSESLSSSSSDTKKIII